MSLAAAEMPTGIDTKLTLPETLLLIKPNYYLIGGSIIFEIYLIIVTRKYVQISTELLKDLDAHNTKTLLDILNKWWWSPEEISNELLHARIT